MGYLGPGKDSLDCLHRRNQYIIENVRSDYFMQTPFVYSV